MLTEGENGSQKDITGRDFGSQNMSVILRWGEFLSAPACTINRDRDIPEAENETLCVLIEYAIVWCGGEVKYGAMEGGAVYVVQ